MTERSEILRNGQHRLAMSANDLWTAYLGLGGQANLGQVESFLSGVHQPGRADYDFLAQALNDELIGRNLPGALPYFDELL